MSNCACDNVSTIPGLTLAPSIAVDTIFEVVLTPATTPLTRRATGQMILDIVSTGLASLSLASTKIQLNADGSAVFAGGQIHLNADGSVTFAGGLVGYQVTGEFDFSGGFISNTGDVFANTYNIGSAFSVANDGSGSFAGGLILLDADGSVQFANGTVVFDSTGTLTTPLAGFRLMTLDTTTPATFNTAGKHETIYDNSGSLLTALTIALPATTVVGQELRYVSKAGVTTVTVTGTVSIGAPLTTLAANGSVAYQAVDTSGTFIRIQ